MTLRVLVPSDDFVRDFGINHGKITHPNIDVAVWNIDDGRAAPEADMLVTHHPLVSGTKDRLREMTSLRHVHLMSLGYDWITPVLPPNATLSNSRGAIEDSTAEMGIALILAGLRELPSHVRHQHQQLWRDPYTSSLQQSTVLILGYGGLGTALEERLIPFKPKDIIRVASTARTTPSGQQIHAQDELPALLPTADVVIVAVPLTDSTRNLVDAHFLELMADASLLVNIGRGGVVDTSALVAELTSGRLRACLDVVEPEPLPAGHPLWSLENCLLTPHVAANTHATTALLAKLAREQILAIAQGKTPANVIELARV
ncbi:MAG TPA: 2-hydroxyacid dehydrogenase [Glaciihabitans sp.]|nr:2-hydroxyacid dehydrogenase [Glaciihabitans sp.]